ncbi:MAG: GT4 family glycosyltransferase PelF [Deltaproteobacteria bacterium]|nr:GT4 family glycosyltransferase PelF [Deltaproteobacteria bacterium]
MTDVCLILEGTYPYVSGGVSVCVHQLIKNLPNINFSIVHISPSGDSVKEFKYPIPKNVKEFHELFLFDFDFPPLRRFKKNQLAQKAVFLLIEFHRQARKGNFSLFPRLYELFFHPKTKVFEIGDLLYSKESWKVLTQLYTESGLQTDFADFFWNARFIYLPVFKILSAPVPKAKIYHTMCTGYAGLYGVMAKYLYERPFFLTEHGIYTDERKMAIMQADGLPTLFSESELKARRDPGFFKQWWISFFEFLGGLTYQSADVITTITSSNRLKQLKAGALPEKTVLIPHGIAEDSFTKFSVEGCPKKKHPNTFRIGFMGRVVSIKDVKTFLRAIKILQEETPNIEVLIMGPMDEDEAYTQECILLSELLGLESVVEFLGPVPPEHYYPTLDVLVLTSISEGQPLVILEAGVCGVPVVATDVGACRELLEGRSEEDKEIGHSGIVTAMASPRETAHAILKILKDESFRKQLGAAAVRRVSRFYREADILDQYHLLYRRYL